MPRLLQVVFFSNGMNVAPRLNMREPKHATQKQVVVIGGGFGGLSFVKSFKSGHAKITLIDKRNHHLFQPLLYQVATSNLAAPDVAQPLRAIFNHRPDVRVLMESVEHIHLDEQTITMHNRILAYDYLVIAAGRQTSFFGNEHWAKFATGLKSLEDAKRIRNDILTAFERAENHTGSETELQTLLTIVVIGAGPTGVEMAGTLAELTRRSLPRDFRNFNPSATRIVLLEAVDRVLPPYPQVLSAKARKQLEELGVEVKLGHMVKNIRHQQVELDTGEIIDAANIIWTAGLSANSLIDSLDLTKDKAGCLKVEKDCSLPGSPNVFAIGDIIHLQDTKGKVVPGVAQGAMQTGKHVANVIARELDGELHRASFHYKDVGEMATIGRYRAVANIGKLKVSGFFAWILWLFVHLIALVGLRNRMVVFLNWLSAYLFERPCSRIIWGANTPEHPKNHSSNHKKRANG